MTTVSCNVAPGNRQIVAGTCIVLGSHPTFRCYPIRRIFDNDVRILIEIDAGKPLVSGLVRNMPKDTAQRFMLDGAKPRMFAVSPIGRQGGEIVIAQIIIDDKKYLLTATEADDT